MSLSRFPYLDPGSGSFILQIVVASLLGLGLALRSSWGKIKGLFGRKPASSDDEQDDEQS